MDYEINVHQGAVYVVGISNLLRLIASASEDGTCKLFDVDTKVTVGELAGVHEKSLYGVEFMKTNPMMAATVSGDHTCVVWDVNSRSPVVSFDEHTDEVSAELKECLYELTF